MRVPMQVSLSLALALSVGLGGCGEDDEPGGRSQTPIEPEPEPRPLAGEPLYGRYCALCHGADGEGYAADDAPMLANQEWLSTASDEFITRAITEGRPGTAMSAWTRARGGPLSDTQIHDIVVYMRTWQQSPRASVDDVLVRGSVMRGRAVYGASCARCHGARGEGVDAVSLANPALLASASDGFLRYAVTHGRTGTRMPAFDEELTPQQINDVVTYVRSFALAAAPADSGDQAGATELAELPALDAMQLVINPDGRAARFTLRDERFVAADAVRTALRRGQRMVILDARATSDWLRSRIPGAIPVPFYDLNDIIEGLPRDGTPMIAYCACPHAASGRVVDALRAAGFTNTAVLDEGIGYWEQHEYPTASGPAQP